MPRCLSLLITGLIAFVVIVLTGTVSPVVPTAASGEPLQEKKLILCYPDGSRTDTGLPVLTGNQSAWVPAAAIRLIEPRSALDTRSESLQWDVEAPGFRLETPALDTFLRPGMTLRLPLVSTAIGPAVNLYGLEKLLGIELPAATGEPTFTLQINPAGQDRQLNQVRPAVHFPEKIILAWDHVLGKNRDLSQEEKPEGLNVISPTWFALQDDTGLISSKADRDYVRAAHAKQLQVWPLITNSFDRDLTRRFLNSPAAMDHLIRQLAVYSAVYDLDGINLDFENVYDEDKDLLTAFVQRLTDRLKQQNLVLSIDVTVPSNVPYWSPCFDRKKLGESLDYVMLMTYDEYWQSSPVSGSVASIGWVEKGIQNTLASVPPHKLLMGVPFYTREWAETEEDGQIKARSRSLSMAGAEGRIRDYDAPVEWLNDKGQYYTEYWRDGSRCRIWLEEERSLGLKTALAYNYKLAGIAAWRLGFEKPEVWPVLYQTLKD
ncbi:MAG TPA: glycosyl hydrolase family 18 protein [Patescibacteria group bacterium]|nr:glycosyl hydrolase family 18 protein [Patescibacteria group bacterium]